MGRRESGAAIVADNFPQGSRRLRFGRLRGERQQRWPLIGGQRGSIPAPLRFLLDVELSEAKIAP
jgi:hypothetical protein